MSYFNRLLAFAIVLALSSPCFAQQPPVPDKSPQPLAAPSKIAPLASPQAAFATPQRAEAAYDPVPVAPLVLQAPQIYAVQRQVVQAVPVAYAAYDPGCSVQQQVVRQTIVRQQVVHAPVVQRQVVVQHAAVARAPRKVITKSRTVTKTKRGLFGRG